MSLELIVLRPESAPTIEAASDAYGEADPTVAASGVLRDFLDALPTVLSEDEWPWTSPPMESVCCVFLTIAWEHWERLAPEFVDLTHRFGLVALDPQARDLHPPGVPYPRAPRRGAGHGAFKRRLIAAVTESLPGFASRRALAFRVPIADLLLMLAFEFSSERQFSVVAAVQALYVPRHYVDLTQSTDLGFWPERRHDEDAVMAEVQERIRDIGLPFLDTFAGPADYAERPPRVDRSGEILSADLEDVAYSLILGGRHDDARALVDRVAPSLEELDDRPRLERTQDVLAALDRDPRQAVALLAEWRQHTLRALRLSEYATTD